jgi:hypothetical protein
MKDIPEGVNIRIVDNSGKRGDQHIVKKQNRGKLEAKMKKEGKTTVADVEPMLKQMLKEKQIDMKQYKNMISALIFVPLLYRGVE